MLQQNENGAAHDYIREKDKIAACFRDAQQCPVKCSNPAPHLPPHQEKPFSVGGGDRSLFFFHQPSRVFIRRLVQPPQTCKFGLQRPAPLLCCIINEVLKTAQVELRGCSDSSIQQPHQPTGQRNSSLPFGPGVDVLIA